MIVAALAFTAAVEVGLDRVGAEHGGALRGRRVGLVAHAASVSLDGRSALAVLREAGVDVVRLFAPEHGIAGTAAAGVPVAAGADAVSGLPVVSLYGAKTAPTAEDLAGLDALVVDLQDAGVRFYSYESTLLLALDAAAAAGVDLVVLDRPNPQGGDDVDGPVADPAWRGRFASLAPGPLLHGLTMGELARFANARRPRPARLTVVPMRGWRRDMRWDDTGRAWVPPSPNLPSSAAALVYPGTCLLETTGLSEGRGTPTPFLIFGAPGLDADTLRGRLDVPGLAFTSESFVPRSSAAAPAPRFAGRPCAGIRVSVTDARRVRPYRFGLTLLTALARARVAAWDAARLDALVGTDRVRRALEAGAAPDAIAAADEPAIAAFRRERQEFLLYEAAGHRADDDAVGKIVSGGR